MSVLDINLNGVQPTLVSGTNIKTINGVSLLGSGDLEVGGGVSFGTNGQIPFMNAAGDDFSYSSGFTRINGTLKHIGAGTTSATTNFLLQNSANADLINVTDNQVGGIGGKGIRKLDLVGVNFQVGADEGSSGNNYETSTRTSNTNKIFRMTMPSHYGTTDEVGLFAGYSSSDGSSVYFGGFAGLGLGSPDKMSFYCSELHRNRPTAYLDGSTFGFGAYNNASARYKYSPIEISDFNTQAEGHRAGIVFGGLTETTSGTTTYSDVDIRTTITQTTGGTGITRSLYIRPTLINAYNYRAIEVVNGNVLFGTTSGNVGINTTSPTAKLQVVGLSTHADNAAAITAGLTAGAMYIRSGHGLDIVT